MGNHAHISSYQKRQVVPYPRKIELGGIEMMDATRSATEWATMIGRVRDALGLSQAALARRLAVSPMAVSRWERSVNEPSAAIYIQLGRLAGSPHCWFFWQRAGLERSEIEAVLGLERAASAA
jgi:ribosome-binding protein aMBF1 (putative translation factor)